MTAGPSSPLVLMSGLLNVLTLVPFFLILGRWLQVLWVYHDQWGPPLVFALASLFLALIGGLTGLVLSDPGANPHLHATLFVVGHLHYLFAGAILSAYLAGTHFWWLELEGRPFPDGIAVVAALLLFAGMNATFLPQFAAGMAGWYPNPFAEHSTWKPVSTMAWPCPSSPSSSVWLLKPIRFYLEIG